MKYDIIIVGAGAIGLAIAHSLRKSNKNILVVDKEKHFGQHTSSRNSQVIHSGIYYPQKSNKAIHCLNGNTLLYNFCNKNAIPYNKTGKIIIAHNENELRQIKKLMDNGIKNGLKGLKIIDKNQLFKLEPHLKAEFGLYIPSTGIFDAHKFMSRLEYLSKKDDVDFLYNHEVKSIQRKNKDISVFFNNNEKVECKILINSAGLWSDKIANMFSKKKHKLMFYKGDYYSSSKHKNIFSHLIYPLPTKTSLGIHAVLDLEGNVGFGPNAYPVSEIDYSNDDYFKLDFFKSINKYVDIKYKDLSLNFSGIRPKIFSKNLTFEDFVIDYQDNFLNLIGIESPGLTSSLSIAEKVAKIIL